MKHQNRLCGDCKYDSTNAYDYPCVECYKTISGTKDMWESKEKNAEIHEHKTRADFLKEVEGIICKDRNEQYGEPEDNFKRIAVFWSNYLDREITSADVAIMMVLFKAARIATGHNKEDNWIDIAGYSLCGAECAVKERSE